eukprot:GEMP01044993.1.p1 GENE.GEMP01044993.1~~GEMP01044993.1.p1  ORF type:complete len:228 (-),score=34.21 GEMP01044993.1:1094-1741(-)
MNRNSGGSRNVNISMEPNKIGEATRNNPKFQQAQADAEKQVAHGIAERAMHGAGKTAKAGALELKIYVTENPASLKMICFVTALCLIVFSIIGIINITNVADPIDYIVTIFNVIFGFLIVVTEGKASWGFCGVREKIFQNFGFLTYPAGRSGFYIYVGIMVLGILPSETFWKVLYIIMGVTLAVCGILQLCMERFRGPSAASNHQHMTDDAEQRI